MDITYKRIILFIKFESNDMVNSSSSKACATVRILVSYNADVCGHKRKWGEFQLHINKILAYFYFNNECNQCKLLLFGLISRNRTNTLI